MTIRKNYLYASIAFYLIAISWSSVLVALLGVRTSSILYYPVVLLLLILLWKSEKIRSYYLMLILTFMIIVVYIALLKSAQVYFNRYIFYPIVLLLSWLIVKKDDLLKLLSNILTVYIVIAIVLSIISFLYVYFFEYQVNFEITNPDGRANKLYLFTFSNATIGNILRPGFIYDEPGAFSFLICYVAILRSMLGQNKFLTLLIMVSGLVTLSFTHVIILIVYILFEIRKKYYLFLIPFFIIVGLSLSQQDDFKFFFDRFKVDQTGDRVIKGDNRSRQISNFLRIVDGDIIIFGNYQCDQREERRCTEHGDISSSPVTPMYLGGILLLFVQVVTSILLLWIAYKEKIFRFVGIAMFLLLLQRPYFASIGYQIMIYTVLFYTMYYIYLNKKKVIFYGKCQ